MINFLYYVRVSSQEQLVDARDVKDLEGINIVGRKLSDTAIIKGTTCAQNCTLTTYMYCTHDV